jgi:hypothetical protein
LRNLHFASSRHSGYEDKDYLFADHGHSKTGKKVSDKTRHNMKSCRHQFFKWVCRREKSVEFPGFPEIEYEFGWRKTVKSTIIIKEQVGR